MDANREQELLREHDAIVWQFPRHWYSVPGVLKEWMDQVLTYGFACGSGGDALHGKRLRLVVSTGGPESSYTAGGHNRFPMAELLRPLEATAHLCGMQMEEPWSCTLHPASRPSNWRTMQRTTRNCFRVSPLPHAEQPVRESNAKRSARLMLSDQGDGGPS